MTTPQLRRRGRWTGKRDTLRLSRERPPANKPPRHGPDTQYQFLDTKTRWPTHTFGRHGPRLPWTDGGCASLRDLSDLPRRLRRRMERHRTDRHLAAR